MSNRESEVVDSHQEGASTNNRRRLRDTEEEEEKRERGGPGPARRLRRRLELINNRSEESDSDTGVEVDTESEKEDNSGGCGPAEKFAVRNLESIQEDLEYIKRIERKVSYVKELEVRSRKLRCVGEPANQRHWAGWLPFNHKRYPV